MFWSITPRPFGTLVLTPFAGGKLTKDFLPMLYQRQILCSLQEALAAVFAGWFPDGVMRLEAEMDVGLQT